MSFYMKIVPTGDEVVLFEVERREDMEVGQEKVTERLTARVWKGVTQSGHAIEVAIVKVLKIEEQDDRVLTDRLRELAE